MNKIHTQTFTLTYGNCAENHKSMEIIGNDIDHGLSKADLEQAKNFLREVRPSLRTLDLQN